MVWKIRCVIMWSFRILGCAAMGLAVVASFYFAIKDPKVFKEVFPPPFGGISLGLLLVGIVLVFEGIGRLLSWTKPLDDLPRFRDRP